MFNAIRFRIKGLKLRPKFNIVKSFIVSFWNSMANPGNQAKLSLNFSDVGDETVS